jgi:hypothetical protein
MVVIDLSATNLDIHILSMCTAGLEVTLWTIPHFKFICFFAAGTSGDQGRITRLPTFMIPGLTAYLSEALAEISAVERCTCVIKIEIEADESNFAGERKQR